MGALLGKIQSGIIACLRQQPNRTTGELVLWLYKATAPTEAQAGSVRRALRLLVKRGMIEAAPYRALDGDKIWRIAKGPASREPLTALPTAAKKPR